MKNYLYFSSHWLRNADLINHWMIFCYGDSLKKFILFEHAWHTKKKEILCEDRKLHTFHHNLHRLEGGLAESQHDLIKIDCILLWHNLINYSLTHLTNVVVRYFFNNPTLSSLLNYRSCDIFFHPLTTPSTIAQAINPFLHSKLYLKKIKILTRVNRIEGLPWVLNFFPLRFLEILWFL